MRSRIIGYPGPCLLCGYVTCGVGIYTPYHAVVFKVPNGARFVYHLCEACSENVVEVERKLLALRCGGLS